MDASAPDSRTGAEARALLRAYDWTATPLGATDFWPERLKAAVETCLDAALPTLVSWGEALTQIYNDAALEFLRDRHPAGFGRPAREAWADVWLLIGPIAEGVLGTGRAGRLDDWRIPIEGETPSMASFSLAFSALRDAAGGVAGVSITAVETTAKIAAEAFRRMLEASPTPFLIVAPDSPRFTITGVNEAYLHASMRKREELIGRAIFEAFPDDPGGSDATGTRDLRASIERAFASRAPDLMPFQKYDIARADGSFEERWWKSVNVPVLDERGDVQAILHHVTDLTEECRSEREPHAAETLLRQSEARFRALVNASSDVVYRVSPDWREMRRVDGRGFVADIEEPSIRWLETHILPEDRPHVTAAIEEAVRTKSVYELEHRVRRVDGTIGWAFSRAIPVLDDNGEIIEWFGMAGDVTARRNAEEALRASEARYRAAFDIETVGVISFDLQGHLIDANDAFLKLSGYTRAELGAG